MKNFKLLFGLLFFVCLTAQAQKIKLKKEIVYVDGSEWLKYSDCGSFDQTCTLYSLSGEELIFMKWISVNGVEPYSRANPDGSLTYVEISFLGLKQKIELQKSQKDILQLLYKSNIVTSGQLDSEKVERLVEKYGTDFSDRLNQGDTNTIIIKEEPKKSGININIGN